MTENTLGEKRDCPECGARFYDLGREPAHCPKCHHEFIPESLLKPRKTRAEEETDASPSKDEAPKPDEETSLENADQENAPATSKRRASMDDDAEADEPENDDELASIGDIDVDIDDEEDDSLLDDDDEDDDVTSSILRPKEDE